MDMELGPKIKHVREIRGKSQGWLGTRVGVHQTQVGKWERSRNTPDIHQAKMIADALQVSLDYLVNDALDDPPAPEITPEEQFLLDAVRQSGLSPSQVVALVMRERQPAGVPVARPGVGSWSDPDLDPDFEPSRPLGVSLGSVRDETALETRSHRQPKRDDKRPDPKDTPGRVR